MNVKRLDLTWAFLLLATLVTWRIGEAEQGLAGGSVAAMATVALIAFFKGRAVALDFMGLRGVKALWRGLLLGWLILVLGLIALAYRLGMPS
jgi:cytochrome c oxidase subunit IV